MINIKNKLKVLNKKSYTNTKKLIKMKWFFCDLKILNKKYLKQTKKIKCLTNKMSN